MTTTSTESAAPVASPATRVALALLILAACLLAASTWRVYGHTWDEPEHLAAGMELLDKGHYEYDTEHPPIARVLIALGPFLAGAPRSAHHRRMGRRKESIFSTRAGITTFI